MTHTEQIIVKNVIVYCTAKDAAPTLCDLVSIAGKMAWIARDTCDIYAVVNEARRVLVQRCIMPRG